MSARNVGTLALIALVVTSRAAAASPLSSVEEDDDAKEPPVALHSHGGVTAAIDRSILSAPNGVRYAEGWAGSDAIVQSQRFELAAGPGVAYHALAPTRGNSGVLSWGAGGHVDVAFEVVPEAHHPVFLHLDGAMFSRHGLTDRVLRGTIALTVRF